jgi:lysophospholipase L1-like esterase
MRARRGLAVVASAVAAGGLLGAMTTSAGAAVRPVTRPAVVPGSRYLALGDSVTFGYRESTTVPAPNYDNPSSFIGYPQLVGAAWRLRVANAACSGETSSSLINVNAASNGCENHPPPITVPTEQFRSHFPLHVRYSGSQLHYALKYLGSHRNVRLVSLMIGFNDIFLCQQTTRDSCLSSAEQQAVLSTLGRNVRQILSAIRHKAHYRGQLLIVNYYSIDYSSAFISGVVSALNRAVDNAAKPFGVLIANGFGQFYQGSLHSGANPCTAGLLTQLGAPGKCGVHPSYAGQSLLALAVERAVHL